MANEPTAHRADLVARVVPKAKIVSFDGRDWESFGEKFDRILIDAPCSGLGALRRRPEARWRRSLNDLKELLPLQRDLIDSAYEMLNPGGIIGFATCSPRVATPRAFARVITDCATSLIVCGSSEITFAPTSQTLSLETAHTRHRS